MTINTYLEPVYDEIERIVGGYGRGAAPKTVAARMVYRSENDLRRDMNDLCKAGRLVQAGGSGAARVYRLPSALEAVMFRTLGWRSGDASVSWYTDMVYDEIAAAVKAAQRDLRRGVLPRDVQPRLPYKGRAEGSLRRDMLAMYESGRLVRVAGHGARQGYRLPTRMEQMAFKINGGMWPHGTEYVASWA